MACFRKKPSYLCCVTSSYSGFFNTSKDLGDWLGYWFICWEIFYFFLAIAGCTNDVATIFLWVPFIGIFANYIGWRGANEKRSYIGASYRLRIYELYHHFGFLFLTTMTIILWTEVTSSHADTALYVNIGLCTFSWIVSVMCYHKLLSSIESYLYRMENPPHPSNYSLESQENDIQSRASTPDSPAPAVVFDKKAPAPAVVFNKKAPAPAVVVNKKAPAPAVVVNKKAPAPAVVVNKKAHSLSAEVYYTESVSSENEDGSEKVLASSDYHEQAPVVNTKLIITSPTSESSDEPDGSSEGADELNQIVYAAYEAGVRQGYEGVHQAQKHAYIIGRQDQALYTADAPADAPEPERSLETSLSSTSLEDDTMTDNPMFVKSRRNSAIDIGMSNRENRFKPGTAIREEVYVVSQPRLGN